ncbi:MAG: NUDIX hydrolase [Rhodobacteraceae bacterium]|nr:NUDIX hydrolase [Paracoccaceae bacterium]
MRRFGERVIEGIRYGLRAGVYAVLPRDGMVLTTFQEAPRPEFQLPGGGIDPGEPPVRALSREVFEETGWTIGPPRRLGAFRRFTYMPEYDRWAEKVCTVYLARPVLRHGPPGEPGHQAVWMTWDEAEALLAVEGDRHFLRLARRFA